MTIKPPTATPITWAGMRDTSHAAIGAAITPPARSDSTIHQSMPAVPSAATKPMLAAVETRNSLVSTEPITVRGAVSVSYTHLDVYKRQVVGVPTFVGCCRRPPRCTLPGVAKHLAAERVRRDVEVLARAGLDLDSFVEESMDSLQRAVPFDAVCVGTIDPSTGLLTGTRKLGGLRGIDSHDHEWGLIEYGSTEPTAFAELAATGIAAAGVMAETVGPPEASRRMSDFMQPRFGFTDELRAVCRDERDQVWAAIALFRHCLLYTSRCV